MTGKVLITGGAGFIGHHTANKLAGEGHKVRIIDNLNKQVHPDPRESLSRLDPAVEFICGDIRDRSQLQAALEGMDAVYHFAAETGVGQSMYEIERYSDVNIQGTAVLCDCIAKGKNRPNKLILASSRAVYGEGRYKWRGCLSRAKDSSSTRGRELGSAVSTLRCGNYPCSQSGNNTLPAFIHLQYHKRSAGKPV
jgi:dTDP-L-rhamnose 4-epimerase